MTKSIKKQFFLVGYILLLVLSIAVNGSIYTNSVSNGHTTNNAPEYSSYIDHSPIEISQDSDFASYASAGDGSVNNPYIISGFNITSTADYGIYVHSDSVTAHFVIENNYIKGSSDGIKVDDINSDLIEIKNNVIEHCNSTAIYFDSSNGVVVINNTILYPGKGMHIRHSSTSNNVISNNTILHTTDDGIRFDYVISFTFENNYLENVSGTAVYVFGYNIDRTNMSFIVKNNVFNSSSRGIHFFECRNITISSNTITQFYPNIVYNSNSFAINLYETEEVNVSNNKIYNYIHDAYINFHESDKTLVENNIVYNGSIITERSDALISNNTVWLKQGIVVKIYRSWNTTVVNNNISSTLDNDLAMEVIEVNNLTIANNRITDAKKGIHFYHAFGCVLANINILNNYIGNIKETAIVANMGDISNLTISNNVIENVKYAVSIDVKVNNLLITDNHFLNISRMGIYLYSGWPRGLIARNFITVHYVKYNYYAISTLTGEGGTIINNTMIDLLTYAEALEGHYLAGTEQLISVGSANCTIYGNYFLSWQFFFDESYSYAYDSGMNNVWYNSTLKRGNYWAGYNTSSGPVSIAGHVNSTDIYPITLADTDNDGLDNYIESFLLHTKITDPDTDADGMPDGWEVNNRLNPLVDDSALDPDNDTLNNINEFKHSTDPNKLDTDADGMPDGWEVNNRLNPLVNDSALDPDNDNLTNIYEYWYHTNPQNNDTDGDGYSDYFEIFNGFDPLSADSHPEESTEDAPISFVATLVTIIVTTIIVKEVYYRNKR